MHGIGGSGSEEDCRIELRLDGIGGYRVKRAVEIKVSANRVRDESGVEMR